MFRVTGLKILGRVCTHIFGKKYSFIIIFFPENLIFLGFTSKFRYDGITQNTDIFFICPYEKSAQYVTLVLLLFLQILAILLDIMQLRVVDLNV